MIFKILPDQILYLKKPTNLDRLLDVAGISRGPFGQLCPSSPASTFWQIWPTWLLYPAKPFLPHLLQLWWVFAKSLLKVYHDLNFYRGVKRNCPHKTESPAPVKNLTNYNLTLPTLIYFTPPSSYTRINAFLLMGFSNGLCSQVQNKIACQIFSIVI